MRSSAAVYSTSVVSHIPVLSGAFLSVIAQILQFYQSCPQCPPFYLNPHIQDVITAYGVHSEELPQAEIYPCPEGLVKSKISI
jgi:hypothetical protein